MSTSADAASDIAPGPRLPAGGPLALPGRGTTFIRDTGSPSQGAPTVMLLHGLGATADLNWFTSYAPLHDAGFRVIGIDHRGHGRGIRARRFRLADCADDVAAVADVLGVDRFVAAGYSMGGPIAQLTWHRHRDRVRGLVLCATSRDFRGGPREQMAFAMLPGLGLAARLTPGIARRRVVRRVMSNRLEDAPLGPWVMSELRRTDPATLLDAASALGRFTSRDWIGDIDVPAAVVITERDTLVPPHRQRKLADAIPGAKVFPVAGDHAACVTAAHRFVPALIEASRWVVTQP